MRILICGDRNWGDPEASETWRRDTEVIHDYIQNIEAEQKNVTIIEGEAKGADTLARVFAGIYGLEVDSYPANWKLYGRRAGPIRNAEMLSEGKPDKVVAFHNNIKQSKGTADMLRKARNAGLPTEVISI